MTGQELATQALEMIRVIDPGEGPTATESARALIVANQALSGWSAMGTPIYQLTRNTLAMSGAQTYTIGSGQTFNTSRPVRIKAAASVKDSISMPMEIVDAVKWASIQDKSLAGTFAQVLYYDGGYPTGNIYVWPKAATGTSLEMDSYKPLTEIASLATAIALPPGYERALVYRTAMDLAPYFGIPVDPAVRADAEAAIAAISQLNALILGDLPAAPPAA